jgi:transcriptional regulator with XRE-family HTH domain
MSGADTPAARERFLRSELRRFREAAELTQRDVADALEWSVSKVLRIETGASRVRPTDLRAMLAHYGITDTGVVEDLVDVARATRTRTWRDKYRKFVDPQFYIFLGEESSARSIRQYQSTAFPGLLQIEPYIRALSEAVYTNASERNRAISIRLERQRIISRDAAGPEMLFLLDEAVLLREVGDEDVMRQQLQHINRVAEFSNVTIRIVPLRAGGHRGMTGASFTILDFADGDSAVFLEERHRDVMIRNNPSEISLYREDFAAVAQRALPETSSKGVISSILAGLYGESAAR